VSPLYTLDDFLDSRAETLPAINSPLAISLTVRHSRRGHRDQLLGNCGAFRRVEPEAKFFNDFSRACMRVRARDVDRILKGEKPGAINLKTAKAFGLSVPSSMLLSADEVIE
jgi:hypothetical protein